MDIYERLKRLRIVWRRTNMGNSQCNPGFTIMGDVVERSQGCYTTADRPEVAHFLLFRRKSTPFGTITTLYRGHKNNVFPTCQPASYSEM
jgi:hypothetical protein